MPLIDNIGKQLKGTIQLPLSKSICNRAIILAALSNNKLEIVEHSNANDSEVLLRGIKKDQNKINVEDAGTAMRFLTAYYAFSGKQVVLEGTKRMHQRPIKPLIGALNELGTNIEYLENDGFPPIKIYPVAKPSKNLVKIKANISSQFISALLLIASKFTEGLTIELEGEIASKPYLDMTLNILNQVGIESNFSNKTISVFPTEIQQKKLAIEADWSAASYFYGMFALSSSTELELNGLHENSLQGDAIIAQWAEEYFGILTAYTPKGVALTKNIHHPVPNYITIDFSDYPDLAQTMIVLCAGLGINIKATGLASLNIKETNRISALKNELKKLSVEVDTGKDFIELSDQIIPIDNPVSISTYKDHRMAMAFSMLSFIQPISIDEPEVVSKSFPDYFEELNKHVD